MQYIICVVFRKQYLGNSKGNCESRLTHPRSGSFRLSLFLNLQKHIVNMYFEKNVRMLRLRLYKITLGRHQLQKILELESAYEEK